MQLQQSGGSDFIFYYVTRFYWYLFIKSEKHNKYHNKVNDDSLFSMEFQKNSYNRQFFSS